MSPSIGLYRSLIRPLLFCLDAEQAHKTALQIGKLANFSSIQKSLRGIFEVRDPRLEVQQLNLNFKSPIGMAAGLDKDCAAVPLFSSLGFGFLELGGVTAKPQSGNPKPRIFRIPECEGIINRVGFPSVGADKACQNLLEGLAATSQPPVLAINMAKSQVTSIDDAIPDYLNTFKRLYDLCQVFVLNVSCPNEENYQRLQEKHRLQEILAALQAANSKRHPLLIKISPDLTESQLDDALDCCAQAGINGVIATNTSLWRPQLDFIPQEKGGFSSGLLFERSLSKVKYIADRMGKDFTIFGCGGITNAERVLQMLQAGASLVQMYTPLVYNGPGLVKKINLDLLAAMDRDGVKHISEYCRAGSTQSEANAA